MEFFPDVLSEVLNGTLSVILFWMLIFLVVHLKQTYDDVRVKFGGRWGAVRTVRLMYQENKPEIALGVIVACFSVRTWFLWYVRFMKNNGHDDFPLYEHRSVIFTLVTVGLIAGAACWIRSMSPYENLRALWMWVIMILTSMMFGFGMALIF